MPPTGWLTGGDLGRPWLGTTKLAPVESEFIVILAVEASIFSRAAVRAFGEGTSYAVDCFTHHDRNRHKSSSIAHDSFPLSAVVVQVGCFDGCITRAQRRKS